MPDFADYGSEREMAMLQAALEEHQCKKYTPLPSRARLSELFYYDPDAGALVRKITRGCSAVGQSVGGKRSANGYRRVQVDGVMYWVHRLIWMICTGEDPGDLNIDHIDGDKSNNKISNLRLSNKSENGQNRKQANRNSTTGIIGVYLVKNKNSEKYASKIKVNRKSINLGTFDTKEAAIEAYLSAKRKIHQFNTL